MLSSRPWRKLIWLLTSVSVLAVVRLGLTVLSYKRMAPWFGGDRQPAASKEICDRCAWALTRGCAFVPRASCLTQALAGHWMLGRLGYGSVVLVGVRRDDAARFHAHAWLKSGDRIVVGGETEEIGAFTVLTELGARS